MIVEIPIVFLRPSTLKILLLRFLSELPDDITVNAGEVPDPPVITASDNCQGVRRVAHKSNSALHLPASGTNVSATLPQFDPSLGNFSKSRILHISIC